jgi:hypothetical protein
VSLDRTKYLMRLALSVFFIAPSAFADSPERPSIPDSAEIPYIAAPEWKPKSREGAVLVAANGVELTVAFSPEALKTLRSAVASGDLDVLAQLGKSGQVTAAKHLDPVTLVELVAGDVWSVKLPRGEHKELLAYVPLGSLAKLRRKEDVARERAIRERLAANAVLPDGMTMAQLLRGEDPTATGAPPTSSPSAAESIARGLMKLAREFERDGAPEVAEKLYERVLYVYTGTDEAMGACYRLESLRNPKPPAQRARGNLGGGRRKTPQ